MRTLRIGARPSLAQRVAQVAPSVLTILWLLGGFALYLSQTWITLTFGVDLAIPFLGFWVCAPVLALPLLVMLVFGRRDARILLPLTLAALGVFWFAAGQLRDASDQIAFRVVREPFDKAVVAAYMPRDRPVFIAFPWTAAEVLGPAPAEPANDDLPPGPLRKLVYDERDTIDGVTAYTWRKQSPYLAETIDGKPQRCTRFAEPHYYLCSFASFS